MSISIDLPAFTMEVIHEGDAIEAFKDGQGHFGLRHPQLKVIVNAMLTTGGGTKVIGVTQPEGLIEFAATSLQIKTRQDEKGKAFAHHPIVSFWTFVEGKGMRPAGDCSLDAVQFAKKIVAGEPYECEAALYVPSSESDTSTVKLRLQTTASILEKQRVSAWLHTDSSAIRVLTQRMVSRKDVSSRLVTFAVDRFQKTSDKLNGLYGGLNNFLALPEMDTKRDTLGSTSKVDPTQLKYLLEKYNMDRDMARKNAVPIARNAVLAMAELCAFERPADANGEHRITIDDFMQFVKSVPAKPELYRKYIGILENAITGFDAAMREYVNDEEFEFNGAVLRPSANVGEKMDLACGRSSMTFAVQRTRIEQNTAIIKGLLADIAKLDPANASHAPQLRLKQELLGAAMRIRHGLRHNFFNTNGDCEDGSFYTVSALKLLQVHPDMITGHVQKFVGRSFMSVHMVYKDGMSRGIPEETLVLKLQRLVEGCVRFASEALRWQATSVPGKTTEYEPAFGFASAPSMPAKTDPGAVASSQCTLSRESCDTHVDWINNVLQGRQLGGHCYAVRVTSTPEKQAGHLCTQLVEVDLGGVLESTVPNFRPDVGSRILADKSVEVKVSGVHGHLGRVPHAQARAALGDAATNTVGKALLAELKVAQPRNLVEMGRSFYNVFAHIGAKQLVSAEYSQGLVTKTIDASSAQKQIHNNCPANVTFSASTLAWDASPTSTTTTSVALKAALAPQEKMLLDAIVEETAPVHVMTADELAFGMEETGHFVNVGFVNGEFVGTDYTGGRLDSDKKIALHLILRLSEFGAGLPEYWNSAAGARAVVESKLQKTLPDARVRVKEIETGLFSAQVVVAAEQ